MHAANRFRKVVVSLPAPPVAETENQVVRTPPSPSRGLSPHTGLASPSCVEGMWMELVGSSTRERIEHTYIKNCFLGSLPPKSTGLDIQARILIRRGYSPVERFPRKWLQQRFDGCVTTSLSQA